jgi:DNA polymerase-3 subunit delta
MDSQVFLDSAERLPVQALYVLHGDEDFLKRQVLRALRKIVIGTKDEAFGISTHSGEKADFAEVHDELETIPFLSPRRLVVVENADPFVTRFRGLLEKYVAQPTAKGVLVLDVKSWPSNTRLAKLVSADATIGCKALTTYRLPDWCRRWAAERYSKQISSPAARLLVDLVGEEMGQLDQELAKLAIYAGPAANIEVTDVDTLVGHSREQNTWKIFDAIGTGNTAEALAILGRLVDQGQEPLRVLGAFSMQLRRLAQAYRLTQQGVPLSEALDRVGVLPFAKRGCEQQLRHLGRRRANYLYDWLLETDSGMKGGSALPERTLLEQLVVRLARNT